jgi:hypothetical protein
MQIDTKRANIDSRRQWLAPLRGYTWPETARSLLWRLPCPGAAPEPNR